MTKVRTGRPPLHGKAMPGHIRQREYHQQRTHEAAAVARALIKILAAVPEARALLRGDDAVRRGMQYLLRQDVTGALQRFDNLLAARRRTE
jgi:hypothetical protein